MFADINFGEVAVDAKGEVLMHLHFPADVASAALVDRVQAQAERQVRELGVRHTLPPARAAAGSRTKSIWKLSCTKRRAAQPAVAFVMVHRQQTRRCAQSLSGGRTAFSTAPFDRRFLNQQKCLSLIKVESPYSYSAFSMLFQILF